MPDWCIRGGSRGWVTTRPLSWSLGKKGSPYILEIPKGREFESSVPWFLHWIMSPDDPRFLLSACIHDHLLEAGYRPFFAGAEWYDAARFSKVNKWNALFRSFFVLVVTIANRK